MGAVIEAWDPALERRVAIKIIRERFLASLEPTEVREVRERFLQEARAAARLNHPAIATVYRVGTERGWPYIVMEWLEAESLEHRIQRVGQLDLRSAARIAVQVLAALHEAHLAGVIHRDVKPGNIMVAEADRAKLLDFGIARLRDSDLARTRPGLIMGTPWYASPEQLTGRPVDGRSDQYGFACVLYEMLCGQPPFSDESITAVLRAHESEVPVPISERVSGLSESVNDVVMRALSKQPEARYDSARAMALALRDVLRTTPDAAIRPGRASAARTAPLPAVRSARVVPTEPAAMLEALSADWTASHVGPIEREALFDQLAERPLHTAPFCGLVQADDTWMLVSHGLVHGVADAQAGLNGDPAVEALHDNLHVTLYTLPNSWPDGVIALLADALARPPVPDAQVLDTHLVDIVALLERLSAQGFTGNLRLRSELGHGVVLFRDGARLLDLIGGQWGSPADERRWETWIGDVPAQASVEPYAPHFPAVTWRRQLRDLLLRVVRPDHEQSSPVRVDAVADAQATNLVIDREEADRVDRGASTIVHLVQSDPAWTLARYVIADLPLQFERHQRTRRWRGLIEPIATTSRVRLHHAPDHRGKAPVIFDAVTLDPQERPLHLLRNVAHGTPGVIEQFVRHVVRTRESPEAGQTIVGAVLMAPSFRDDALSRWMELQKVHGGGLILGTIDAFAHLEGRFHTRAGPVHILLVERGEDGTCRPMMPA